LFLSFAIASLVDFGVLEVNMKGVKNAPLQMAESDLGCVDTTTDQVSQ
jgi:hypothetical protein